jgi:hypothetical protein
MAFDDLAWKLDNKLTISLRFGLCERKFSFCASAEKHFRM